MGEIHWLSHRIGEDEMTGVNKALAEEADKCECQASDIDLATKRSHKDDDPCAEELFDMSLDCKVAVMSGGDSCSSHCKKRLCAAAKKCKDVTEIHWLAHRIDEDEMTGVNEALAKEA